MEPVRFSSIHSKCNIQIYIQAEINCMLFFILLHILGVHVYRIERSPITGKSLSPWVVKRLRGAKTADNSIISSRLVAEANILR